MAGKNSLDSESVSPLYKQLTAHLRASILSGEYPVNSRIPSEQELCERYRISRVTVRKALSELTAEGMLERHQGKGSFVCLPRLAKDLRAVNGFSGTCRAMRRVPGTVLLRAELVPCEPEDIQFLHCAEGDRVVSITRLRLADNMPVMLETNRFPERFAWLLEEDLTRSLYDLMEERGLRADKAVHEVSLCYASAFEARHLGVEQGSALLLLNEQIYDQNGLPMHSSVQHIRGDRFTFRI